MGKRLELAKKGIVEAVAAKVLRENLVASGVTESYIQTLSVKGAAPDQAGAAPAKRDSKAHGIDTLNADKAVAGYTADIVDATTANAALTELKANKNKADALDILNASTNPADMGLGGAITEGNAATAVTTLKANKDAADTLTILNNGTNPADMGLSGAITEGNAVVAVTTLKANKAGTDKNTKVESAYDAADAADAKTVADTATGKTAAIANLISAMKVINDSNNLSGLGISAITDQDSADIAVDKLAVNNDKAGEFNTINTAAIRTGAGKPNLDNSVPMDFAGHAASVVTALDILATMCEAAGRTDPHCLSACQAGFHFNGWTDQDGVAPGFQC